VSDGTFFTIHPLNFLFTGRLFTVHPALGYCKGLSILLSPPLQFRAYAKPKPEFPLPI
jgi:hypothetical protein